MKKEFSFYEFVGILVPAAIFLFCGQLLYEHVHNTRFVDFSVFGETVLFLIVCYGVGHLMQSFGNLFESLIWIIYGGKPTNWLTKKNRFGKILYEESLNQRIEEKVKQKFGDGLKNYGRIVHNFIYQKGKTERIDIFNGNYSLFRGLSVSFLILTICCIIYVNWTITLIAVLAFFLSVIRMIRFAKYYAKEIFTTFLNLDENESK